MTTDTQMLIESLPATPLTSRNDPTWLSLFGDFQSLLGDLPADWYESKAENERRSETRFWCDCEARLTPLDPHCTEADRKSIPVVLKDISRHGIGLVHADPLPYRIVQLTFGHAIASAPTLVVRLQWCRFEKPGVYQSGGQIQRVIPADGSTGAEPGSTGS
jgi:hypothetical protein